MLHAACSLYREHLHHTDPLCTHSALLGGILYSAPALCILYDSFLGLSYLYWAREFLHSAPASCIGTLSALSWLWVSFSIPHSASCIQHVSHSCSFGPASAFCILHLHPASGAVHSFGPASAFCILHLHLLHRVQFTALGLILHSAFCICILHRVPVDSFGPASAFCILHLHPASGVLIVAGPTYPSRLWCAWELFVLCCFAKDVVTLRDRLTLRSLSEVAAPSPPMSLHREPCQARASRLGHVLRRRERERPREVAVASIARKFPLAQPTTLVPRHSTADRHLPHRRLSPPLTWAQRRASTQTRQPACPAVMSVSVSMCGDVTLLLTD